MLNIGWIYDKGIGLEENNQEAVKWYKKAADLGNHRAQLNMGIMLAFGKEIQQDYVEAYKWLTIVRVDSPEKNAKWKARGVLDRITPLMSEEQIKTGTQRANKWRNQKK